MSQRTSAPSKKKSPAGFTTQDVRSEVPSKDKSPRDSGGNSKNESKNQRSGSLSSNSNGGSKGNTPPISPSSSSSNPSPSSRSNPSPSSPQPQVSPSGESAPISTNANTNSQQPIQFDLPTKESPIMIERTLWVIMNLIGKLVEVQVKTGEMYEGILHTATTEKGVGVILKMAKKKNSDSKTAVNSRPIDTFIIYPGDFVQLYAKDVSLDLRTEREFATDSDISGHGQLKERVLQPWIPDDQNAAVDLDLQHQGPSDWDQFELNRKLFGVESTWDESLYTTSIDKELYKQKHKEASRIANEIEKSTKGVTNFHIVEERGFEVDVDEEERYGAVIRNVEVSTVTSTTSIPVHTTTTSSSTQGKYIPPGRRAQMMKEETKKEENKEETTTISSEEVIARSVEPKSPLSPRSPKTPMSPGKDGNSLEKERMRIRSHLVSERYKNSTPVLPDSQNESDFLRPNKSPLISPLIGNVRSINALSLEPQAPQVSENIVQEFFDFSLSKQKEKQPKDKDREKQIADLKTFSKSLEKVVLQNPSDIKSTVSNSPDTERKEVQTANKEKKEEKKEEIKEKMETTKEKKDETKDIKEKKEEKKEEIKEKREEKQEQKDKKEEKKEDTKEEKKDDKKDEKSDKKEDSFKSKLNPNAKTFKPMSANAPSFTPGAPPPIPLPVPMIVPIPVDSGFIPEFGPGVDPNFFYGPRQPMFPGPYPQHMVPNQQVGVFPGPPMRMPPHPVVPFPNSTSFVGPFPPQQQIGPNPMMMSPGSPTQPQLPATKPSPSNARPFVPAGNVKVTPGAVPVPIGPYPTTSSFIPGSRIIPQPGTFYPAQFGQPVMPQPFYPTNQSPDINGNEESSEYHQ